MFLCRSVIKRSLPLKLHTSSPRRPSILTNICRSTPWLKMPLPSAERVTLETLEQSKHDKWGYVIYRCTYRNDRDWNRFKQLVHKRSRENIEESDTPQIAQSLEWTFVEDRDALDGASRAQLRERFNKWAAQVIATEQPRAQPLPEEY
jgi:hypothetical protein